MFPKHHDNTLLGTFQTTLLLVLLLMIAIVDNANAQTGDRRVTTQIIVYSQLHVRFSFDIAAVNDAREPMPLSEISSQTEFSRLKHYSIEAEKKATFSIDDAVGRDIFVLFSVDRVLDAPGISNDGEIQEDFGRAYLPVSVDNNTLIEIIMTDRGRYAYRSHPTQAFQDFAFAYDDGRYATPLPIRVIRALQVDPWKTDGLSVMPERVEFGAKLRVAQVADCDYTEVEIISAENQTGSGSPMQLWVGRGRAVLPSGVTATIAWSLAYNSVEDRVEGW